MKQEIDFDDYADRYEDLARQQVLFFDDDSGYFAEYKVLLTRYLMNSECSRIMDFGCGIGRSIPHFRKHFPGSRLVGCDVSPKSLKAAEKECPFAEFFHPEELPPGLNFDLIFAACVFHHIPPPKRPAMMEFCRSRLADRGSLVIFEHNPYNPVTRKLVSTCPFDKDAVLLARKDLVGLFEAAQLENVRSGYTLFFPKLLGKLRPLERFLQRFPLGGQYYVSGQFRLR